MRLVAILTGMGTRRRRRLRQVEEAGGSVLVQDEASCVIYGMPRAALETTPAAHTVALTDMANQIATSVRTGRTAA